MPVRLRFIGFKFLWIALIACHGLALQSAAGQSLFNGRDLTGWSGDPKLWSVREGQIVGTTVGHKLKANTFLVWQGGTVADFELTFQARIEGNNNSGVQYRSQLIAPETWKVIGYQADMHAKPEYLAMLYSEGTGLGILAQSGQKVVVAADSGKPQVVGETTKPSKVDVTQWHEYTIIARGNHLIHKLDGQVTVDVTDHSPGRRERGILALQIHTGPEMSVFFKEIDLKTFPNASDNSSAGSKAGTTDQGRK